MDKLRALGRGTQIMFIAAVLLLIDTFLRWQQVKYDLGPLGSGSAGQNAWHGFWGVVMGILTIVLIARIAARLAAVDVPIPLSFATTSFVLGVLIAICAVLKVLTDDYRTFWAFAGLVLAIIVAVGAWLEVQEAGGMEHLRSQMPTSDGSAATAAPAAAASAAAAPAAAAPATEPPATPEPPTAEEPPPVEASATAEAAPSESAQPEPAAGGEAGEADAPDTDTSSEQPS